MQFDIKDFSKLHYGQPSAKASDLEIPFGLDYCGDFYYGDHKLEADGKMYDLHPGKSGRRWRDTANKKDCVMSYWEFVAFDRTQQQYIVIRILNK